MDEHPCPSRAPPLERVPRAPPAGPEALVQDGGQDRCRVLGGALRLVEVREEELQRRLLREDVGLRPHLLEEGAAGRPCPADAGWTPGEGGLGFPFHWQNTRPSFPVRPPGGSATRAGVARPRSWVGQKPTISVPKAPATFFFEETVK